MDVNSFNIFNIFSQATHWRNWRWDMKKLNSHCRSRVRAIYLNVRSNERRQNLRKAKRTGHGENWDRRKCRKWRSSVPCTMLRSKHCPSWNWIFCQVFATTTLFYTISLFCWPRWVRTVDWSRCWNCCLCRVHRMHRHCWCYCYFVIWWRIMWRKFQTSANPIQPNSFIASIMFLVF